MRPLKGLGYADVNCEFAEPRPATKRRIQAEGLFEGMRSSVSHNMGVRVYSVILSCYAPSVSGAGLGIRDRVRGIRYLNETPVGGSRWQRRE